MSKKPFQKVGSCLYRYLPNGVYYGRFKVDGKEIRCSLETTDRKFAERALAKKKEQQTQIDRSKSKMTLAELCDAYLKTVQHQKLKTIERKTLVVQRIKNGWPTGSKTQVSKIRPTGFRQPRQLMQLVEESDAQPGTQPKPWLDGALAHCHFSLSRLG